MRLSSKTRHGKNRSNQIMGIVGTILEKRVVTRKAPPSHNHFMELSTSKIYELLTILLLSAILPHVEASAQQLTVKGYGVSPVKPGDTALVFYASVSHNGSSGDNPVVARLEMEKCCLDEGKTQNCNVVKLVSGLAFIFHPHNSHNLWMFYLNYDLHNREGSCIVHLITKDYTGGHSDTEQSWTKGPPIKIPFKTQLQNPPGPHGEHKRVCSSDKYNALQACPHMDNCLIRNSGMKSLVNPQTGVCTAAPTCHDSSKQFLSLASQKCQNIHDLVLIHDSFSYEMTHTTGLSNSVVEQSNHFQSMLQRANLSGAKFIKRISCGHGHFVANPNGHGYCTCDPSWRSVTVDEWRKNGGIMNDEDDASIPRFCTVPLRQRKQLNFLIYAAIGISLIVIFALTICYNLRMNKPSRSRENLKLLKDTHNSPSNSGESSSDDNSYDEERKLVSAKSKSLKSLENVEADEIISEVTNRREPTVSKKSSKADGNNRNDDDDSVMSNKSKQSSGKPPSSKASRPSSSGEDSKQAQKKTTKPPPKSKTKSEGQHSAMLSDYFVDPFDPNPSRNLRSVNFGGFASSEADEEEDYVHRKTAENRIAPLVDNMIKIFARSSPSTDELLDLKPQEKLVAHVPMQPSSSVESYPSIVASNGSLVELVENDINVNRLSSEELTHLRKDQWAEFLATLDESKEYVVTRCNSQTLMQGSVNDEVDSEWEDSNSSRWPPQDFYYFNRNHKPKAAKVRSVPIMMQYHPFQSQNTGLQQKFDDDFNTSRFAEGSAECYQTLSNISPAKMCTSTEMSVSRTQSSIWSNVASENTQEESASRSQRVSFSAVRDPPPSPGQDGELVRIRTIYGDSDVDSDAALEELEKDSVPVSTGCSLNQTIHLEQPPSPNLRSRDGNQNNRLRGMNPEQLASNRIASEAFFNTEGYQKQEPKAFTELIGENSVVTPSPNANQSNRSIFNHSNTGESLAAYQLKLSDSLMHAKWIQKETVLNLDPYPRVDPR